MSMTITMTTIIMSIYKRKKHHWFLLFVFFAGACITPFYNLQAGWRKTKRFFW